MSASIFERLRTTYGSMSPAHRRMAEYIAENYAEVAFMAANQLASACETHESVVVKFAVSLGYTGYPEMLRDIQEAAKTSMDPTLDEADADYLRYHALMLSAEEALKEAARQPAPEAFERLTDAARGAARIYVVGFHTDALFVNMITFYLDFLGHRAIPITDSGVGMFERLRKVAASDLLVAVSFPPYLARIRDALRLARDRGARTALLTDRRSAPVAAAAEMVMAIELPDAGPISQRTVVTSLISAWVTTLAVQDRERALASMDELDQLLAQTEILTP